MVCIRIGELFLEGVKVLGVLVWGRIEVEVFWEVLRIFNGEIMCYEILFVISDVLSVYVLKFNVILDVFNIVIGNLMVGILYYV